MSIIESKHIAGWPDANLRWKYEGGEYKPLEGVKLRGDLTGTLTFRFAPTWRQRLAILFGRDVYVSVMTFGDPLQPLRVDTGTPEFLTTETP